MQAGSLWISIMYIRTRYKGGGEVRLTSSGWTDPNNNLCSLFFHVNDNLERLVELPGDGTPHAVDPSRVAANVTSLPRIFQP